MTNENDASGHATVSRVAERYLRHRHQWVVLAYGLGMIILFLLGFLFLLGGAIAVIVLLVDESKDKR